MSRLIALSEAFARLGPLAPVPVTEVVGDLSLGAVAAHDVVALDRSPARPEALIAGVAVASADLVGASASAPAFLPLRPPAVAAGDALPDGTDAVLPPSAVSGSRAPYEVSEPAFPGLGARLAGADLAAGTRILAAGERIASRHLPALARIGRPVAVRRARVAIDGIAEAAVVRAALAGIGVRIVDERPDLVLSADPALPGGLALRPGEATGVGRLSGVAAIRLPARIDGVVAALHALVLPALDALCAHRPRPVEVALTRKIVSQVGASDMALLAVRGSEATPLAVGDLPLSALIHADAFAVLPPESEGLPAGARLEVRPLLGQSGAP